MTSGYPTVWSECRCVTNSRWSLDTSSPSTPARCAAAALRTTPGPQSTRYGVSSTTIATAGPDRSGSALGVPVPRRTILELRGLPALTLICFPPTWQVLAHGVLHLNRCRASRDRYSILHSGWQGNHDRLDDGQRVHAVVAIGNRPALPPEILACRLCITRLKNAKATRFVWFQVADEARPRAQHPELVEG